MWGWDTREAEGSSSDSALDRRVLHSTRMDLLPLLENTSPQQQLAPFLMWRPDVAPGTQSSLPKLRGVPSGPGSDAPGEDEDYGYHLCCASARDERDDQAADSCLQMWEDSNN